ncbi:hypothetical protein IV203_012711 [Nitzschia inconspicua]|uniref:Uncharacterized protein n=1 Tax=Nitzschia inconspicua TaxID=303405 RepID=A0A9K3P8V3_9STRA|nr:hypothetical protein IV203_012711 [Nitzschia inconspicua]
MNNSMFESWFALYTSISCSNLWVLSIVVLAATSFPTPALIESNSDFIDECVASLTEVVFKFVVHTCSRR